MGNYSGYLIIFDEEERASLLREVALTDAQFTDALSVPDWRIKEWEVCVLSFGGEVLDAVCLAQGGRRVATAKQHIMFSECVDLDGLEIHEVQKHLSSRIQSHFTRSASGRGKRVPPETWKELINVLKALRPVRAEAIDRLLRLQQATKTRIANLGAETVAIERDAVGMALEIFDPSTGLRKKSLRRWAPPLGHMLPFLEGIEAIKLTEEQILAHDVMAFPGAQASLHMLGAKFHVGNRELDVIYQNRTPLERTLGVDLVYYNYLFHSYTLVQYKRMAREYDEKEKRDVAIFRPSSDQGFREQLRRMADFRLSTPDDWSPPRDWRSYRLNGDGFLFKLCPSFVLEVLSEELSKGMYIPREYVEALVNSDITDGPKGGTVIKFENVQRYLNNTEFAWLVRDGWIGTRGVSTEKISKIIQESLLEKRAVVSAVSVARR